MKRNNKKALYESIMSSVAREVKKVLNETYWTETDELTADISRVANKGEIYLYDLLDVLKPYNINYNDLDIDFKNDDGYGEIGIPFNFSNNAEEDDRWLVLEIDYDPMYFTDNKYEIPFEIVDWHFEN